MPYELKNPRDGLNDESLKKSLEKRLSEITCLIDFIEDIKEKQEEYPNSLIEKNPLLRRLEDRKSLVGSLIAIRDRLKDPDLLDEIIKDSDPEHVVGNFLAPVIGTLKKIENDTSDRNYSEIIEKALEPKVNEFLEYLETLEEAKKEAEAA